MIAAVGPVRRLWFADKCYRQFPAPRWVRRFSTYESEWDARRGLSLPRHSSLEELAHHIREALGTGYAERAEAGGRFAQQKLPLSVFDATVRRALVHLGS